MDISNFIKTALSAFIFAMYGIVLGLGAISIYTPINEVLTFEAKMFIIAMYSTLEIMYGDQLV